MKLPRITIRSGFGARSHKFLRKLQASSQQGESIRSISGPLGIRWETFEVGGLVLLRLAGFVFRDRCGRAKS